MYELPYSLKFIFSAKIAMISPPEGIGPTPEGLRVNFYFKGGEFNGPKLSGQVLPVGGDNFLVRSDGVAKIDMRTTLKTSDGALISAHHTGLVDIGADGYTQAMNRQLPSILNGRVAANYITANPSYLWLNRLFCLGILQVNRDDFTLSYDIYSTE